MKPLLAIQRDGCIHVSLINDSITTLDKYVIIPIHVKRIEVAIKVLLIDIKVYNSLLDIKSMR